MCIGPRIRTRVCLKACQSSFQNLLVKSGGLSKTSQGAAHIAAKTLNDRIYVMNFRFHQTRGNGFTSIIQFKVNGERGLPLVICPLSRRVIYGKTLTHAVRFPVPVLALMKEKTEHPPAETRTGENALLVVFIHGFRSMATTFERFPKLLEDILMSEAGIQAITVSYPTYKTKGEMDNIVSRFAQWLTELVSEHEKKTGAGNTKVVLCAHSVGGFLAADLLRKQSSDQKASIFSKIIACIAYDTPYLGMNGSIFKNIASRSTTSSRSTSTAQQADKLSIPCSNIKWAQIGTYALGCSILAGSAGAAIVVESIAGISAVTVGSVGFLVCGRVRRDFSRGFKWATDYCQYLKDNLFNKDLMKKRVEDLMKIEQDDGVIFRVLYASLPGGTLPSTFITLPELASQAAKHFLPATNKLASNEIMAHTGMFCEMTNDGYGELGLLTANLIRDALMGSR